MSDLTPRFQIYNDQQTKNPVVVLKIDGVPGVISSTPLFTRIRYGDPDVFYGGAGLVYGGLRPLTATNDGGEVLPLVQLEGSSLTLSQAVEPEQGRGSVSTLTFQLLDKDQYITRLFTPGEICEDILNREITVYLGYTQISYPEDYHIVFRGRISSIDGGAGYGVIQISDPNVIRRQKVFFSAQTTLTTGISPSDTVINVAAAGDFHKSILNSVAAYDPAIKTYLLIGEEYIEYGPSATVPAGTISALQLTNVVRGSRGSSAISHPSGEDVVSILEIEDHAIDMALKIMLSGWSGPWVSGVVLYSIVATGDPILMNQTGAYVLNSGVDAFRDYNLQTGDRITVTGDSIGANNGTFTILRFGNLAGTTNRILYTDNAVAAPNFPTTGVLSIRSQFDSYPVTCGSKLGPLDVDIDRHLYLKNTFLGPDNRYRFLLTENESGKSFIESQIYLPLACYSLTRFGKLSVGLTKPPLADTRLKFLNQDNILNAPQIRINRGVNNRRYFNEITWQFDQNDSGDFGSKTVYLDTESLSRIKLSSILPIEAKGAKTDLNFNALINRRSQFLLSRYKNGALATEIKVDYGTGVDLEAGDVIAIEDNGGLQIQNWSTGQRNLGTQLWEIIQRSLDLKSGNVTLRLYSNVGADVTDRFATFSPSSNTDAGSTTTGIKIIDSYGAIFPGNEKKKWEDYLGLPVVIHSSDYTFSEEVTLTAIDPNDPYKLLVSPPLSLAPPAGYIVDIPAYPTGIDPYENSKYKTIHAFFDPAVDVVAGVSSTVFGVGVGDISKFEEDQIVLVHETEWAYASSEVRVLSVDTGTNEVTVAADLGFTPASGDLVEFIGFADGGGPYRWI